ncbi:MAG: chromosome segregation protein SMC [Armatimonadota bacterium]|nr:chromosome segregation protein SMC [Armatimonadota bacterium]
MHLKRLELQGFKTFADRTELDFGPGITAIVGPNGSGKSNIFDAIRWVLGETSWRALRTHRMDDVIFAGAADRRAHGLAQVDLTIDNESGMLPVDFAEITVTRRATRAGEGEYFLNRVPCRLRDIQMLFLGTGLGGRSYAMIGQGEVDAILDASPEERRALLEEAAGLARYKRKLRETERRLLQAQHNLVRITDLLAELDDQKNRLASQAEVVQRYRDYERRAKQTELYIRVEETRRLRAAAKRVAAQYEAASQRRDHAREEVRTAERELTQTRQRLQEVVRAHDAAQQELVKAVGSLSEAARAMDLVGERLRAATERGERLREDLAQIEADRERAASAVEDLRSQHVRLGSEVIALRATCAQAEARFEGATRDLHDAEVGADQARSDLVELQRARSQTAAELAALAERMAAVRSQEHDARAQLERMQEERVSTETRRADLEREVAAVSERLRAARSALDELSAERGTLAAELDRITAREHSIAFDRQAHLTRLRLLEEAQAELLGYEQGAREVLLAQRAEPERFRGVRGALVDFVDTDRDHRAAVEAALGDRLFGLVTDSVAAARTALEYLREHGTARATLLPLDAVPDAPNAPDRPAGSDVVGDAFDLVRCAPMVEPFVRAALRGAVVVDDLDAALRLRGAGYGGRIVTLAGEVLDPDGVLSGGRRGDNRPLGRPQEIATLRCSIAAADARAAELQARREEVTQRLARLDARISSTSELVDAEQARLGRARQAAAMVAEELSRRPRVEHDLEVRYGKLRVALEELRSQEQRLQADLAALDAELGQAERALAVARERAESAEQARRAVWDELTALRIRVAEAETAHTGLGLRLQEREADLTRIEARAAALRSDIAQGAAQSADLQAEHAAAQSRLDVLRDAEAHARERIQTLSTERDALEAAIVELEARSQSARAAEREQEEGVHRLEVRRAQLEAEQEAAARRILDEHGIPFEEAEAASPDRIDRDALLDELEGLRGLIASLGQVNLRAIDEYEQVSSRCEELRAQADDLTAAREALLELSGRLEHILKRRFAETFDAVDAQFADCFRRLFGGGTASLRIVTDDKGEEGIEMLAQPPGKKVKSLGALSGGERVMVALALVFALLRVHPSPFCVFDEIEAALDDVNTRRVTDLLHELSRRTQIVIITHNKATMESADVLYGVTMHEPGVSSIVSVRMAERETAAREPVAAR